MSAETELETACNQWRSLACAESEAIHSRDWSRLAACQEALQQLQAQFLPCFHQARQEWAALGPDGASREQRFQVRVSELLEIEQQNSAVLEHARRDARAQLNRSEQAALTLRRLRASYAPARPAGWTSFS